LIQTELNSSARDRTCSSDFFKIKTLDRVYSDEFRFSIFPVDHRSFFFDLFEEKKEGRKKI
jgi:hypothetical protein